MSALEPARCVAVAWDGGSAAADAEAAATLVADAFGLPLRRLQVRSGDVVAGLIDLARTEAAAYVAVGGTHRGVLGRVRPGATATRLARSGVAVIVPPRGYARAHPPDLRVIVAGYDGTDVSRAAVRRAADLAERAGAALRVRAVAQGAVAEADPLGGPAGAERLRELVDGLPPGVRPDGRVVVAGDAAGALIEESDRGADFLFVGSHRYGPVLATLLGSVSDTVCRYGHVPVAVVPDGVDR